LDETAKTVLLQSTFIGLAIEAIDFCWISGIFTEIT